MSIIDNVNPLPEKGDAVSILAVRALASSLLACTVVRRDDMLLTLRASEPGALDGAPLSDGARVRVVYGDDGLVCHTSGCVEESLPEEGLLQVELDDAPVRQERREYIRAELPLDLHASPEGEGHEPGVIPAAHDEGWRRRVPVNLSGSGIRFPMERPVDADDTLVIALRLPTEGGYILSARGRVVRLVSTESGVPEVAVQFLDLSREQEDELINLALKVRLDELA